MWTVLKSKNNEFNFYLIKLYAFVIRIFLIYFRNKNLSMRTLTLFFSFLSFSLFGQAVIDAAQSRFVTVGDVTLHYKVFGKGEPLILLHGASESLREWRSQIPELSKYYKVYAVDTRGHGQSSFTDRPLSYDLFANDIKAFMQSQQIDSAFFVGFGDGGIVAMKIAIQNPELVRKIVAIGTNSKPDTTAVSAEIIEKVRKWDFNKMAAYWQAKFLGNPNPQMLPKLAERMQKLLLSEPNFSVSDFKQIKSPVLFMTGDKDFIKLSHTVYMYEIVPNGFLSVVPAGTHYCFKDRPEVVNANIIEFLKNISLQPKRF